MAITLQNNPGTYYSAHGDLIFVVYESVKANDPVTYPDYKYVCDIYIDSILVTRLKAVPRPDNKMGIFNISNIIRNYVAANFNPTALQLRAQETGSGEFYISAVIEFGEEYGLTLFTNLLTDSVRTYFNHYNGRLLGQNTSLIDYLDKAMTVRPAATPVYRSAKFCFIPFLPTDDSSVTLSIKSYNSNGLIGTLTQAYSPPATSSNIQQLFNISPVAINAHTPGFINDAIDYYTVEFQTTNIIDDSLYRFDLVCEPRYEVFSIHFLNRFGGFESRDFTKVSRKTIDIEKSEFGKLPYTMDASGVISYKNSNNVYNETRSVYASQYREKMVLNTDLLTDGEYLWMADLILSPMVYIEMDGYFIPIALNGNNYEFRKSINDKLTNLTINIEFGEQFNSQYR
jgi:hypothetical protein